jgi:hypothetical protein
MRKLLLASLVFALPLFGYTVTPAAGGTEVTIDGVGSFWEYDGYFGTVTVELFEYDAFVSTQQTFAGDVPPAAFERLLLPFFSDDTLRLFVNDPLEWVGVAYEGKPGRFLYIAADQAKDFSANLRVYDTSRAAENLGTEIPIVRASEFRTTPFALLGMPRDVRFGNTASAVTLHGGATFHEPAYAQLGSVPGGRVIVEPDPNGRRSGASSA